MKITMNLNNSERILAALKAAPSATTKQLVEAVSKSTLVMHSAALREAPVNKQSGGGNLRQSIRYRLNRLIGVIEVNADYAAHVEFGTKAHKIVAKNKSVLANRRTGQFFGKVVNHPGTHANPFLRRAFERSYERIKDILQQSMDKVISMIK